MDRTSWRGMQIDHPADWELTAASPAGRPGRCRFADRTHERLDVRWRGLKYVPNLDVMLEKHRRRRGDEPAEQPLTGAPRPWRGLVRRQDDAAVVHAGRFFRGERLLAEVTVVWPGRRDRQVERAILAGLAPEPESSTRLWQAMGLSVTLPREFDLTGLSAQVGRIRWDFTTARKRGPRLSVERIALVKHWLKEHLRDWLADELPERHEPVRRETQPYNAHRAERLMSRVRPARLGSLRRSRRLRLDVAWECPIEARVYRASYTDESDTEEIDLPAGLEIRCCRPVRSPQVGG